MPRMEQAQQINSQEIQTGSNAVEQRVLPDVIAEKTKQLGAMQSEVMMHKISTLHLSPAQMEEGLKEGKYLQEEEASLLQEWESGSSAVEQSDFEAIKECWRAAAEEQFGIKDFKLEQFRRTLFDEDAMQQAFAHGQEWNKIFDEMIKYVSGESYDMATKAFEVMGELEEEIPGSVKLLHEKYGISSFQRYPKDILLKQLESEDPSKESGLLIFGENDWNGAFDEQHALWNKIYTAKKDRLNFRIVECGNGVSLAEQLIKVREECAGKVTLAFLSAHSEPEGFFLGMEGEKDGFVDQESIRQLTPTIKDIFADKAQVIANACSSGAMNGWLKDFSREARLKAVGPDRPAAIEDVDFVGNELVPKYYDNDIYSGYHNGFLLSKQKKRNTG